MKGNHKHRMSEPIMSRAQKNIAHGVGDHKRSGSQLRRLSSTKMGATPSFGQRRA